MKLDDQSTMKGISHISQVIQEEIFSCVIKYKNLTKLLELTEIGRQNIVLGLPDRRD